MTPEQKEALARYKADEYPGVRGAAERHEDLMTLADAYMELHDETAVTEEWLLSIGFYPDGAHIARRDWGPFRNGTIQVYETAHWWLNGTPIHPLSTRGDVLAILRALKISLTPPPTKGEG